MINKQIYMKEFIFYRLWFNNTNCMNAKFTNLKENLSVKNKPKICWHKISYFVFLRMDAN